MPSNISRTQTTLRGCVTILAIFFVQKTIFVLWFAVQTSSTKMNPPETSQSKKFQRLRAANVANGKKGVHFSQRPFYDSHIFFLLWHGKFSFCSENAVRGWKAVTIGQSTRCCPKFPMTLKFVVQGQLLIGFYCRASQGNLRSFSLQCTHSNTRFKPILSFGL